MTDREKAIVMAYTGICMLAGDKLSIFYEYVESIMGCPVYTHEMITKVVNDLIKEKAKPDFIALCADESSSEKPNKSEWEHDHEILKAYSDGANEVLDKIRAVIEGWQVDIHDNEYDADEHDFVFERIFEIIDEFIDKYKAEGGDKE